MPWKNLEAKKAYQKEYRKRYYSRPENRVKTRRAELRNKYGLTLEDYENKFTEQCGICAICGGNRVPTRCLVVDHCHKTGKFRGLLCVLCNSALGHLGEDISLLPKIAAYLEKHRKEVTA